MRREIKYFGCTGQVGPGHEIEYVKCVRGERPVRMQRGKLVAADRESMGSYEMSAESKHSPWYEMSRPGGRALRNNSRHMLLMEQ